MKTFSEKVAMVVGAMMLAVFSMAAMAEVKVIVNPSISVNATADDVANVFLAHVNTLPGGIKLIPYDQAEEIRNEFYNKIAKRDPAQLKAYWARMIFTGRGQPPKELASDAEVVRFVSSNPDAIGYVSGNAQLKGVKVLLTAN